MWQGAANAATLLQQKRTRHRIWWYYTWTYERCHTCAAKPDLLHDVTKQARCRRNRRRIWQIMERKHTERYASSHTGRRQHVWYWLIPIHSEHSRKASTEGKVSKNMMYNHQQLTVVPKKRMVIKRKWQKIIIINNTLFGKIRTVQIIYNTVSFACLVLSS